MIVNIVRSLLIALMLVVVSPSLGCMRYVPSRAELAKQNSKVEDSVGGPEQFKNYQLDQMNRLYALQAERKKMFINQPLGVYILGPGDLLKMEVLGIGELSTEFSVEPSGTAKLYLIGEVVLAGRELWQVRQEIVERLRKFIRNPEVSLTIKEIRSNKVSVIGEVKSPGSYPLSSVGLSVSEIISLAGGRTEKAGSYFILIPPQSQEKDSPNAKHCESDQGDCDSYSRGIPIEFERLYGTVNSEPLVIPVLSGDLIVIPEAGKIAIDGEVNSPGAYPINSSTTVLGAIASAGGLTYAARIDQVELVRNIGTGQRAMLLLNLEDLALNSNLDIKVMNGDLVRVPSDSGRFDRRQVVEVINRIFKVGVSGGVK